uniref:Pancreatic trypsin inhibitor n=1 Tax=Rhipicephalus zambeziensis TaxID=60191 RepID=A0A224YIK4_9ACAR
MALRTYICGQTSTGGIFLVLAAAAMVTSVPYEQGAPICAKEPADTCLEPRSVTSRKYTTYSYDISSGECVSRISCGPVRDMEGKNVFLTLSMCEANCWGFDRSNVRGSR